MDPPGRIPSSTRPRKRVKFQQEIDREDAERYMEALREDDVDEMRRLFHKYPERRQSFQSAFDCRLEGSQLHCSTFDLAVRHKSLSIIDFLVQEGQADVNSTIEASSEYPIHVACRHRELEVIKRLVEYHGARLDIPTKNEGLTPLLVACKFYRHDLLEYLIGQQTVDVTATDSEERSALHLCVLRHNDTVTSESLANQVQTVQTLLKLVGQNKRRILNQQRDRLAMRPLDYAFNLQINREALEILQNGQNRSYDETLKHAAESSRLYYAYRCMRHNCKKANTHACAKFLQLLQTRAPLHFTIACPFVPYSSIKLLLEHPSCDLDQPESTTMGDTLLHIAVRHFNIQTIRILLSQGRQRHLPHIMSLVDRKGNTPLHTLMLRVIRPSSDCMSSIGDMLTILKLLLVGAKDIMILNQRQMCPLFLAACHEPHKSFVSHAHHDVSADAVMLSAIFEMIIHNVGVSGSVFGGASQSFSTNSIPTKSVNGNSVPAVGITTSSGEIGQASQKSTTSSEPTSASSLPLIRLRGGGSHGESGMQGDDVEIANKGESRNVGDQSSQPPITIFSTIDNLGAAIEQASPTYVKLIQLAPNIDSASNLLKEMDHRTRQSLSDAEILVTEPKLLKQLLEYENGNSILHKLKWCQCTFAGVDAVYPVNKRPSFQLTRFSGPFGPIMAEWCIGRIIAFERNFEASWKDQQDRLWPTPAESSSPVFSYRYLSEMTAVVLGCGSIGKCIGMATKAMGMRTIGFVRVIQSDVDSIWDEQYTDLIKALAEADYIISVLPSTPETKGLLSLPILQQVAKIKRRTQSSKPPVLINCGRGNLISTDNLVDALDYGYLDAAILDVAEQEPLPSASHLWHPRITISPHVSGLTRANDVPQLLLENYDRYTRQMPLLHSVNWDTLSVDYYEQKVAHQATTSGKHEKKASSPSDLATSTSSTQPGASTPGSSLIGQIAGKKSDSTSVNSALNANAGHPPLDVDQTTPKSPKRVLLGVTGSVAAVKAPEIAVRIRREANAQVKILLTTGAQNFWSQSAEYNSSMWNELQMELSNGSIELLRSEDEWRTWNRMGDPVMHIELRDWADCLVVAPLSAHTLAKLANGLCDDALSSVARAWDYSTRGHKPMVLAPAMNTNMWEHPLTQKQLSTVQRFFGLEVAEKCRIVAPQVKTLACGQVGNGALAPVPDIVDTVKNILKSEHH